MCGIAGIFRRRGRDGADPRRLGAMTDAILHRGPDDYGYLLLDSRDGGFALGQDLPLGQPRDVLLGSRRLSIIDASPAGRQPMTNETRDIFLVFNGEIYNYVELGDELRRRGHRFSSASDTEVVVHAYEEWGTDCVSRFNGMWAFALWDQRRRRLFCSRDRFGIKPFYYSIDDDVFVFASEIKAILGAALRRVSPDYGSIHAFLTQVAVYRTGATLFEGIRCLPAAHNFLISTDTTEMKSYWDYGSQTQEYDYRRPEQTFAELLEDSVRLQLRSDVPVGIALSGGVDSSSIAALARRILGPRELKVFTAEFPGTRHDERRHAELVARRFGAEFHVTEYRPKSLTDDLRRVIWQMDYPVFTGQILARWQLMGLAAAHVKVILEGQGSDEMLAGYPNRYFGHWFRDELHALTARDLLRTCGILGAATIERFRRNGVNPLRGIARRLWPMMSRPSRWHAAVRRALTPEFCALAARPAQAPTDDGRRGDRLANALRRDHGRDLLPSLLMFGDAISMGRSLESRVPFLDHRLVEFTFGLPDRWKFDGIESKIVLKRALRDVLPPEILARKDKIGFGTPVAEWIRAGFDAEVRPLLLSSRATSRGIFDPVEIENTLGKFARGDARLGNLIFCWLSLEIWFQIYIDGDAANAALAPLEAAVEQRSRA
jgi:asparagine synthase (glutamine-hydrolysing)